MEDIMDLFDKVKTELVDAAAEVQGRAKDVSNIMQLQKEQKSKESFVENIYVELGKKYYEEHKEDEEEDFSELEAALNRIEELKDEISGVKGTRICGNCGSKVGDYALYCQNCGAKLGEDVEKFEEEDIEVIEE